MPIRGALMDDLRLTKKDPNKLGRMLIGSDSGKQEKRKSGKKDSEVRKIS